jgi:flagellar basal-body rod protein FlgB
MLQSSLLPMLEEVARFSQARHGVLAGNLANVSTPGYKARDLPVEEFQERLSEIIEQRNAPPTFTSPGHPEPESIHQAYVAELADTPGAILHHDGNNVSMEQQVTEMAKNQMQHNLALAIMRHQFSQLQTAISERV